MKAVGDYLVVTKEKLMSKKTDGGLLLDEGAREDIRYSIGKVISVGDRVPVVQEGMQVYYDRRAGHTIEIENDLFHVIRISDVVVVL